MSCEDKEKSLCRLVKINSGWQGKLYALFLALGCAAFIKYLLTG